MAYCILSWKSANLAIVDHPCFSATFAFPDIVEPMKGGRRQPNFLNKARDNPRFKIYHKNYCVHFNSYEPM